MKASLSQDRAYAEAFTEVLGALLGPADLTGLPTDDEGNAPEVNVRETFKEAGVMTSDKGLVLYLSDGTQVYLTVQAFVPVEA